MRRGGGDVGAARAFADEARAFSHCSQSSLELLSGDRNATLSELRMAFDTMESARLLVGVDGASGSIADDVEFITMLRRLGLDRWCGVRVVHNGL